MAENAAARNLNRRSTHIIGLFASPRTHVAEGINARFMIPEPGNSGSPIRALIREKRIGQSRSVADHQMALLMKEGRIFQNR